MQQSLFSLLLIILLASFNSSGQDSTLILKESFGVNDPMLNEDLASELSDIRENFSRITHKEDWLKIDTIELHGSTEGGIALVYHGDDGREKFSIRYFGEMGQKLTEYFLMDENLSMIIEQQLEYNRPIYWDESHKEEFNDSEVFDLEKSTRLESRSYILDNDVAYQWNSPHKRKSTWEDYLEHENNRIWSQFVDDLDAIDRYQSHAHRSLIGVWQWRPELGSGWSNNYQFFENGSFNFNHNQMICDDSILVESGTYKIENDSLVLNFDKQIILSGATLEPSNGSCASVNQLVGGTEIEVPIDRIETFYFQFVSPLFDYEYLERIQLDGSDYFRLLHNPENYE